MPPEGSPGEARGGARLVLASDIGLDAPPEARDSATVVLCRDAPGGGIEVFMLERHLKSDFLGGAYVFPGGTVDEADGDPTLAEVVDGVPPDAAARYGDTHGRGIGFPVCAIRETFEEAGVLLAREAGTGAPVRFDGEAQARYADARRRIAAGQLSLPDLARAEGIRYAVDLLAYYARWITPEASHRRYDARFFVAVLPEGQDPIHDDVETTASVWVRPAEALERAAGGSLSIIFPTRKMLERIAGFASTSALMADARAAGVEPVTPSIVVREGRPYVVLPGDPTEHVP